jgi:hypothetical protein
MVIPKQHPFHDLSQRWRGQWAREPELLARELKHQDETSRKLPRSNFRKIEINLPAAGLACI